MILPWQVDVPQARRPVMNWLIILATIGVFWLQLRDFAEYEANRRSGPEHLRQGEPGVGPAATRPAEIRSQKPRVPPGITGELMLQGWHLKGMLGYMWLHAGFIHLLGNMWFLWIFGNAVCAKIGNIVYLPLYIFLGVVAAIAQLLMTPGTGLGASGAINGIVGMYLVLFYENEITCYWTVFLVVWRQFSLRGFWMILVWLFWDVVGALLIGQGSRVAYFAHLGSFAMGFGIAFLLCYMGWITMEEYEKSLYQTWQEWRHGRKDPYEEYYGELAPLMKELKEQEASTPPPAPSLPPPPKPVPMIDPVTGETEYDAADDRLIIVGCACGKCIRATPQYAGKVVRCPHCKAKVQIPEARPPDLLKRPPARSPSAGNGCIRFRCHCGTGIKVPARYAGRSGKCPKCGSRIRVPRRGAAGESA